MSRVRLFTPGPTEVPAVVREASSLPVIHHRSEEFGEVLRGVRARLAWLCGCTGEVVLLSSSGTGGMEAAVSSLFSPGDEVVVVRGGKFGDRWMELARHYGLKAQPIDVEWGRAVPVEHVVKALTPRTRGLLVQGCESSTGAYHPLAEIGKVLEARDDVLLVVDGIMTLGIHDVDMARDRVDVVVGASQKAFMSPPGLALVAVGPRALARLRNPGGSFYFSLSREIQSQKNGGTGFTPAISLIRGLEAALTRIENEGKAGLFGRHLELQKMARNGLREMGCTLFNRDPEAAIGVTVIETPAAMNVKAFLERLRREEGLWMAGGQGKLEGKILRLGHFGACEVGDLEWALEKIREKLGKLG
jgi:aspartate aminotransferase-like enzyme